MNTRPCVRVFSTGADTASRLDTKIRSVVICAYFEHNDIDIRFETWDGRTDTLPTDGQPVLVDATVIRNGSRYRQRLSELLAFAEQQGHTVFENNQLLTVDGFFSTREAIGTLLDEFMQRHHATSKQE